ncbi:MAG TPA: class I SAM-dependent methyltransferase, partial [Myxococcota bacterium]|nr:class I SAM-dependent methyltransferase [Myxococcota bacterium]
MQPEPAARPQREARRRRRPVTALDRALGRRVSEATGHVVRLVLWDGEPLAAVDDAAATVTVEDRTALLRLALSPQIAFGELYGEGRVDVEGDLVQALVRVYRALGQARFRVPRWARLARAPSLGRSRRDIHHHYDLSNAFYALWLDADAMQYTCAYYPEAAMSLEAAQRAKMEHVCRKVWLRPGERVIEAGCGWGGLALYMARQHGARVRAFNISREQVRLARERAEAEGLQDRVEFVEDDYRNIDEVCDAFVS